MTTAVIRTAGDDDGESGLDCSACADLSDAQAEALAMDNRGVERIACDPTCLDGVSDPLHCNCEFTCFA